MEMVRVLVAFAWFSFVSSYNVDVDSPVIKTGRPGTAFSVSLAPFTNKDGHHILVGAPLALSSSVTNSTVTSTGVLFSCPVLGPEDNCVEIGNEFMDNSLGIIMDRQLYGQSLAVYQSDKDAESRIHCCAPLYRKFFAANPEVPTSSYYPTGLCVQLNGTLEFRKKTIVCRDGNLDADINSEHYMCMGGASAVAAKNFYAIGAVGAYSRRGSVVSMLEDPFSPKAFERKPFIGVEDYRKENLDHPELTYYLGYSLAIASGGERPDLIAGAPRGNELTGRALLLRLKDTFDSALSKTRTFKGEQVGEFFGYSVCAVDTSDDGNEEILVGAPFHADANGQNQGAVYVFLNAKTKNKIRLRPSIPTNDAFFGTAVASPGDLNQDGFNDVAIGAPGDGDDGTTSGVVYIYFGKSAANGSLSEIPSQIVRAADSSRLIGIKYFGYTVVAGNDLDDNGYPDILVGSFESNKAILLRTRSLVSVEANLTFSEPVVSFDIRECIDTGTGKRHSCFDIIVSMNYSFVKAVDPQLLTMPIVYDLTLDVKQDQKRFFFPNTVTTSLKRTIQLTYGIASVVNHTVYVSLSVKDRLSPFFVKLTYGESEDASTFKTLPGRLPPLIPIITEAGVERVVEGKIAIDLACNDLDGDRGCNPDLHQKLAISFDNNIENLVNANFLVAGEGTLLLLNISVTNEAEEAHQAKVIVRLPGKMTYKDSTTISTDEEGDVTCELAAEYELDYVGETEVECGVGNPLGKGRSSNFVVKLQNSLLGNEGRLGIEVNATSKGKELGQAFVNNDQLVYFDVKAIANLKLTGTFFYNNKKTKVRYATVPSQVAQSPKNFEELGHSITHRYTVRNFGPSTVHSLKMTIWWPVQTKDGKDFLYLRSFVIPGDDIAESYHCDAKKYIDYCHYKDELSESPNCVSIYSQPQTENPPPECDDFLCVPIHCEINQTLIRRAAFQIIINATAVAKTLQLNYSTVAPEASSVLQVHIVEDYFHDPITFTTSTFSRLEPEPMIVVAECVPIWVIIASVIGGLLILTVIILLLNLCGFFRSSSKMRYRVRGVPKGVSATAGKSGGEEVDGKNENGGGFEMRDVKVKSKSPGEGSSDPGEEKKPGYLKSKEEEV